MRFLVSTGLLFLVACRSGGADEMRTFEETVSEDRPYDFHRAMAYSMLRTDQPRLAIPHIRQLLKLDADEAEPEYLMGAALLGLRQHEPARQRLLRALELDEEHAPSHALLGIVLDNLGDHEGAEREHQLAAQLQEGVAAYHNNLGFGLFLQGRYQESISAYQRALDQDPANPRVHNNLAFAHAKTGDLELAYAHFKLAGGIATAENNLGFVYETMGDQQAACVHYRKAAESDPDLRRARENVDRLCKDATPPVASGVQAVEAREDKAEEP